MSVNRVRTGLFTAAAVLLAACTVGAQVQTIVFADVLNDNDPAGNSIRMVRADGTGLQTLIPTGPGVRGIDVDVAGGRIYWTDVDNFVIRRARFNGSQRQDIVNSGVAFPSALRLDRSAGLAYWGDQTTEDISRAPFDGSLVQPVTTTPFFRGLAIDTVNERLYWTVSITASTGRIVRSHLNGGAQEIVVPTIGSSFKPGNIALDIAAGKIYWTDAVTKFIRRSNLNGTSIENLFDGEFVGAPKGLALDLAAGKVYWGQEVLDQDSGGLLFGEIRRMNLTGTGQEVVVSALGSVNDIVLLNITVCLADFNGDGSTSVQDIFDFLAAYFSNDSSADFNGNGTVTVQDIFDFLAAYFAGC